MAQITTVTSESLQATIRRLLPSQQGFGEDLQATNVITPIIDLTSTAEGSNLPSFLQTASDSSVTTVVTASATPATIVSNTGFWRVFISATTNARGSSTAGSTIQINDGASTNIVWQTPRVSGSGTYYVQVVDEIYVFLRSGDSLEQLTTDSTNAISTSVRQVADINGNLVNPTGFTFE
tara:strand:- start:167 stop:703 length:537 start_codon:yes stop_codon:yes gene_type:complete